jgi:hypothetical protein
MVLENRTKKFINFSPAKLAGINKRSGEISQPLYIEDEGTSSR